MPTDPTAIPNLVAFWDFQEPAGSLRVSKGPNRYALKENPSPIARIDGGPFGKHAMHIAQGQWLQIARKDSPALNIAGPTAQVTVVAWLRRGLKTPRECEAVAGIWHETGLRRQYCMFLDLMIWDSGQQVGGHVSAIGGPTPGYKYCMDASIGATPVPLNEWSCCGFTYDGHAAKSYFNGKLDLREGRNPYPYSGGLFDPGDNGADFTVGAVHRAGTMGNWFTGDLGGLAIFNRALPDDEIRSLA